MFGGSRDGVCESVRAAIEPRPGYGESLEGESIGVEFDATGDSGRGLDDEFESTEDIVDRRFIHEGLERSVNRGPRSMDDLPIILELSTSLSA